MKIKIDDIQTPCSVCLNHFEHEFDGDSSACQSCDYNIAIQLLKFVTQRENGCEFCEYLTRTDDGWLKCEKSSCKGLESYTIDYQKIIDKYKIEVSSD